MQVIVFPRILPTLPNLWSQRSKVGLLSVGDLSNATRHRHRRDHAPRVWCMGLERRLVWEARHSAETTGPSDRGPLKFQVPSIATDRIRRRISKPGGGFRTRHSVFWEGRRLCRAKAFGSPHPHAKWERNPPAHLGSRVLVPRILTPPVSEAGTSNSPHSLHKIRAQLSKTIYNILADRG